MFRPRRDSVKTSAPLKNRGGERPRPARMDTPAPKLCPNIASMKQRTSHNQKCENHPENVKTLPRGLQGLPAPTRGLPIPTGNYQRPAEPCQPLPSRRLGLVCAGATQQRVVLASPVTAGNKLLLLLPSYPRPQFFTVGLHNPNPRFSRFHA